MASVSAFSAAAAGEGEYRREAITCFAVGTRLLTSEGYKTVETLDSRADRVITSDGRAVPFKLFRDVVEHATTSTAPFRILPGALGRNVPVAEIRLSPTHKVRVRKGVWLSPMQAALSNPRVQQYGVGGRVEYFHVACPDFLRDNLVAEGAVVESFGTIDSLRGTSDADVELEAVARIYTWNDHLGGYTRAAHVYSCDVSSCDDDDR